MAAVRLMNRECLMQIFLKHKDAAKTGISTPSSFKAVLLEANAPCIPCDDALEDHFKRFDVLGDNCIGFDALKRAVETPDALERWLDEGSTFKLGAFAPALRAAISSNRQQPANSGTRDEPLELLRETSVLDESTIDLAVDASVAAIKLRLKAKHAELRSIFQAKERALDLENQKSPNDRLVVAKMKSGDANDFYEGLAARVGFPSLDFEHAMHLEHCRRGGSDYEFNSGNPYNIHTTPMLEWSYVLHAHVPDDHGKLHAAPEVVHDGSRFHRVIHRISDIVERYKGANLSRAEVISVILYSGPMFVVYNSILRQFPSNVFEAFKVHANLFSTTIFVLASALQKLARQSRVSPETPLFRGLGGSGKFTLELPDSFFKPDDKHCTGYMDFGFQSFTADKDTALTYSGVYQHKPSACMLQIYTNTIDRAADISGFSQFPKEKEFTFVPCSFVQKDAEHNLREVRWTSAAGEHFGFLTVVPARVNANLKTETIEQLQGRKKNMHVTAFACVIEETRQWMRAYAEESGRAQARAVTDDKYGCKNYADKHGDGSYGVWDYSWLVSKIMKQMQDMKDADAELPDTDYVNDLKYKALVTRMLLAQSWSKQKLLLWLENENTSIRIVGEYTLKSAHRQWLSYLKRHQHAVADMGSSERAAAAVKILQCKGLMVSDNATQEEVDGEPLIYAAAADSWALDDFQFVIDAGANIEAPNKHRETAMHAALDNGDAPALQALLNAGADVHRLDKSGNTSVYVAASKGYSACLQSLLSAKADPLITSRGGPPIIAAASRAHTSCIKILIANCSDINVKNKDGWTALRCAVEQNHLETVQTLIGLKADVNICSTDGRSPVYAAAAAGRASIVSNLIAHDADVNICDRNGVSPVLAAAFSKNLECVELLVSAGASNNSLLVVALHEACEIGDRQAVEALFADGADVNQCNRTGESPFQVAVERGHSGVVAALLLAGAVSPYGNFHDPESMPPSLTCALHPHPIQKLRSVYSSGRYSCDACSRSGSGWVYHCKLCGWDVHPACALQHSAASD